MIVKDELHAHLINRYREMIEIRYQYDAMKSNIKLPASVTPETIRLVREYFLHSVYPDATNRAMLEEAFSQLSSFLSKPSKVWHLLGNMTAAIFRFGRLFPAALKAGYKALHSFIGAKGFEGDLHNAALEFGYKIPLDEDQFMRCISRIPRKKAESFIGDVMALFNSISNTKLVSKTIEIMENVIDKMKKYPKTYTDKDIEGIRLGLEILQKGYDVFAAIPEDQAKQAIAQIRNNEFWFLDQVYNTER